MDGSKFIIWLSMDCLYSQWNRVPLAQRGKCYVTDQLAPEAKISKQTTLFMFPPFEIKCCESSIMVALGHKPSHQNFLCKKFKQIILHIVGFWVSPSPYCIPTTEPAFIGWQRTIRRSPSKPPKFFLTKSQKQPLTSHQK